MPGITFGTVRLDLLLDAQIPISGDSVFATASRAEWTAHVADDGEGNFSIPVRPLLIREPAGITLVDTGFGEIESFKDESAVPGRTFAELTKLGVSADDVTRVIITHAHGDHIQGNMRSVDGKNVPAFVNAEFVMQQIEADAARKDTPEACKDAPEAWELYFEPIDRAAKLRLIDGDTNLTDTIACVLTPGHTIGHQSVVVTVDGESACYLGDLALHILNLQRPEWGADWAWSRDHDRDSRIKMCEWARKTGGTLILPHDGEHSFVRVDDDSIHQHTFL